ncbi:MAG: SDR family oxidoreductase [Phycisphaerales bacterium]|nr:SDR family oxidoreductase [Phycisphaerales bacterium]
MGLDLAGKRALVCGSSQGIGLACAQRLARLGAGVTLLARDGDALARVCGGLAPASEAHDWLVADFAEPEAVQKVVADHVRKTSPYAIIVNNTGGPPPGPIVDAAPNDFMAALRMHLACNQLLLQTLLPGMKQLGYGRVINIISISVREPIPGLGVSNTTRWAVAAWAKTCAGELGKYGITVNNVLPGYTDTARLRSLITRRAQAHGISEAELTEQWLADIPAARLASPDEIASAVGFLASPSAGYVNGINLPVDGGRLSSM